MNTFSAEAGDEAADRPRSTATARPTPTQTADPAVQPAAAARTDAATLAAQATALADAAEQTMPDAAAELRRAAELAAVDVLAAQTAADAAAASVAETAAAQARNVFAVNSDAEQTVESALFAGIEALETADLGDLPGRLASVRDQASAVQTSAEAFRAELVAATGSTVTQPVGGDVSAQLAYLSTYALDYNEAEWGNLNPFGGDCVNFTSQGLIARGWTMDDAWYSDGDPVAASPAWVSTPHMADYLDEQGLPSVGAGDLDRVRVGDVGVFDWDGGGFDHTMTVSKVEHTADGPKISFVSHNDDGLERDLTEAVTVQHPGADYRIYLIP